MRYWLLASSMLAAVPAFGQTVNLNLGSVTNDGGPTSFNNHMNFGGNETNLATGETEHYSPNNVSTAGGAITLTANPDGTSGAITSGTETYGMPTPGGFSITNGTLNITATMPAGANTWPALWLEPANPASLPAGTDCEMDIIEAPFNNPNQYQATSHISGASADPQILVPVSNLAATHTYGVTITPSLVTFLLDGKSVGTAPNSSACANVPMMLLANVAIGGWASDYAKGQSALPAQMVISQISYTGNQATGGLIGAPTANTAAASTGNEGSSGIGNAVPVAAAAPAVTTDPTTTVTASPTTPSTANTDTITPGQGSLKDCSGNTWTITPSGSIQENGAYTPGGGGTAALTIQSCQIIGEDNGHGPVNPGGWLQLNNNGQNWAADTTFAAMGQPSNATPPPQTFDPSTAPTHCTIAGGGDGLFHVRNGSIIGPDGQPFIARGINIGPSDMSDVQQKGTTLFKGLNFIRLATSYNQGGASQYQSFVSWATSQGIIVEIEDHAWPSPGSYSGAQLATESAWYASLASAFKSNPFVWFGTMNEPTGDPNAITAQEVATYNAVRGTGNNSIIMLEADAGGPTGTAAGMPAGPYAKMTNVVWDAHYYGWLSGRSTDQNTVNAALKSEIQQAQTIPSADGTVPVIIGEYGDSTDGMNVDPNGAQVVEAVITAATSGGSSGAVAWSWGAGGTADQLLNGGNALSTPYGETVAMYINTDRTPLNACQQNQQAQNDIATATQVALTPAQGNAQEGLQGNTTNAVPVATAVPSPAATQAQADITAVQQQAAAVAAPGQAALDAVDAQITTALKAHGK